METVQDSQLIVLRKGMFLRRGEWKLRNPHRGALSCLGSPGLCPEYGRPVFYFLLQIRLKIPPPWRRRKAGQPVRQQISVDQNKLFRKTATNRTLGPWVGLSGEGPPSLGGWPQFIHPGLGLRGSGLGGGLWQLPIPGSGSPLEDLSPDHRGSRSEPSLGTNLPVLF